MDSPARASTEVTRSNMKLVIQTRLPVIESDMTASVKSYTTGDSNQSARTIVNTQLHVNNNHDNIATSNVPSDVRCTMIQNGINGSLDDAVLPSIASDYAKTNAWRSRQLTRTKPVVISVNGSARRPVSVERGIRSNKQQPTYIPNTPVYRLASDSGEQDTRNMSSQKSTSTISKMTRKSVSLSGTPIKQSYFVIQKPGVELASANSQKQKHQRSIHRSKSARFLNGRADKNTSRNSIHDDMAIFSISFRNSDSPTCDSGSEVTLSGKDVISGSNRTQRLQRSNSGVGGCVTGTAKVLHSRSEYRVT